MQPAKNNRHRHLLENKLKNRDSNLNHTGTIDAIHDSWSDLSNGNACSFKLGNAAEVHPRIAPTDSMPLAAIIKGQTNTC